MPTPLSPLGKGGRSETNELLQGLPNFSQLLTHYDSSPKSPWRPPKDTRSEPTNHTIRHESRAERYSLQPAIRGSLVRAQIAVQGAHMNTELASEAGAAPYQRQMQMALRRAMERGEAKGSAKEHSQLLADDAFIGAVAERVKNLKD